MYHYVLESTWYGVFLKVCIAVALDSTNNRPGVATRTRTDNVVLKVSFFENSNWCSWTDEAVFCSSLERRDAPTRSSRSLILEYPAITTPLKTIPMAGILV